ncbi:MAG TPA: branched-chain amino acid ABC transporter permease [Alphaproteobacteria bacterium]|nr:branched-chain amino acid ABC transporter permease [Alphaproteobacteria bacterium]
MNTFVPILYTGVVLGSIFAACSVGLALLYGTLRFLNLAHGGFLVIGGYVAWYVTSKLGMPFSVGFLVAGVVGMGVGLFTYIVILRPLLGIGSPRWDIATIIASVGMAIVIEALVLQIFGPRLKSLPAAVDGAFAVGVTVIRYNALFVGLLAIAILIVTNWFLKNTRNGIALRAVASDINTANLIGIPGRKIFAVTVAVSSALTTTAGVLLGSFYFLRPDSGQNPMLTAIVVVVFGGLGSIRGAIAAAYIIGFVQAAVSVLFGVKWAMPALFSFMIIMLIFRPYGLYGKPDEARI